INPAAWTIAPTSDIDARARRSAGKSLRSTCRDWKRSEGSCTGERLRPITDHPSARRRVTMALPIPELAPVTTANPRGLAPIICNPPSTRKLGASWGGRRPRREFRACNRGEDAAPTRLDRTGSLAEHLRVDEIAAGERLSGQAVHDVGRRDRRY